MSNKNKHTSVAYRVTSKHADRIEALARITGVSKTKIFEALIDAAYEMSCKELERLINESDFQIHFNASCKLAQKLKIF